MKAERNTKAPRQEQATRKQGRRVGALARRFDRPPMKSMEVVSGAGNGLADALLLACDGNLPAREHRRVLKEIRWYLEWFQVSGITVQFWEASGERVALGPTGLPAASIEYIGLRSARVVTTEMLEGLDDQQLRDMLQHLTPLGSGVFILPVREDGEVPQAGAKMLVAQTAAVH